EFARPRLVRRSTACNCPETRYTSRSLASCCRERISRCSSRRCASKARSTPTRSPRRSAATSRPSTCSKGKPKSHWRFAGAASRLSSACRHSRVRLRSAFAVRSNCENPSISFSMATLRKRSARSSRKTGASLRKSWCSTASRCATSISSISAASACRPIRCRDHQVARLQPGSAGAALVLEREAAPLLARAAFAVPADLVHVAEELQAVALGDVKVEGVVAAGAFVLDRPEHARALGEQVGADALQAVQVRDLHRDLLDERRPGRLFPILCRHARENEAVMVCTEAQEHEPLLVGIRHLEA